MMDNRQKVLAAIVDAFRGVELGDGVSLHETIAIDHYGTAEERHTAREPDEKHDWRRLVDDPEFHRIRWIGGLCFYDAVGLRFHLPAYLTLAVLDFERKDAGDVFESLMFHLTILSEQPEEQVSRFSILTDPQRQCVRDVLVFLRDEYELESEELDQAIAGYWSCRPETVHDE